MARRAVWEHEESTGYAVKFQHQHNPLGPDGEQSWTTQKRVLYGNSRAAEKASAEYLRTGKIDTSAGVVDGGESRALAAAGSSSSAKPGAE